MDLENMRSLGIRSIDLITEGVGEEVSVDAKGRCVGVYA